MNEREKKLEKLRAKRIVEEQTIKAIGESFTEALELEIDKLKEVLGGGVEIRGIDSLINSLKNINSFEDSVKQLHSSLSNFKIPELPDSIKIDSLDSLIKAIDYLKENPLKVEQLDTKAIQEVSTQLAFLTKQIEVTKAPTPSQRAEDYIPYRRVVKVGQQYFYDDIPTPVAGGGGSSNGSTSGGSTLAEQQTQTTSLQLIDDVVATHDSAANSKGVQLEGEFSASPSKVDDGDAVRLRMTRDGRLLTQRMNVDALTTPVNNNYSSAQTNTSQVSAPGANKRLVVTDIIYSRDTAGNMKLVEDPAGTPATKFGPHYFAATGGMVAAQVYIPLTTNKALGLTSVGGGNETITLTVITENV